MASVELQSSLSKWSGISTKDTSPTNANSKWWEMVFAAYEQQYASQALLMQYAQLQQHHHHRPKEFEQQTLQLEACTAKQILLLEDFKAFVRAQEQTLMANAKQTLLEARRDMHAYQRNVDRLVFVKRWLDGLLNNEPIRFPLTNRTVSGDLGGMEMWYNTSSSSSSSSSSSAEDYDEHEEEEQEKVEDDFGSDEEARRIYFASGSSSSSLEVLDVHPVARKAPKKRHTKHNIKKEEEKEEERLSNLHPAERTELECQIRELILFVGGALKRTVQGLQELARFSNVYESTINDNYEVMFSKLDDSFQMSLCQQSLAEEIGLWVSNHTQNHKTMSTLLEQFGGAQILLSPKYVPWIEQEILKKWRGLALQLIRQLKQLTQHQTQTISCSSQYLQYLRGIVNNRPHRQQDDLDLLPKLLDDCERMLTYLQTECNDKLGNQLTILQSLWEVSVPESENVFEYFGRVCEQIRLILQKTTPPSDYSVKTQLKRLADLFVRLDFGLLLKETKYVNDVLCPTLTEIEECRVAGWNSFNECFSSLIQQVRLQLTSAACATIQEDFTRLFASVPPMPHDLRANEISLFAKATRHIHEEALHKQQTLPSVFEEFVAYSDRVDEKEAEIDTVLGKNMSILLAEFLQDRRDHFLQPHLTLVEQLVNSNVMKIHELVKQMREDISDQLITSMLTDFEKNSLKHHNKRDRRWQPLMAKFAESFLRIPSVVFKQMVLFLKLPSYFIQLNEFRWLAHAFTLLDRYVLQSLLQSEQKLMECRQFLSPNPNLMSIIKRHDDQQQHMQEPPPQQRHERIQALMDFAQSSTSITIRDDDDSAAAAAAAATEYTEFLMCRTTQHRLDLWSVVSTETMLDMLLPPVQQQQQQQQKEEEEEDDEILKFDWDTALSS